MSHMKKVALIAAAALALTPAAANAQAVVLGAAAEADASCPDDCLVEAKVTGFQTTIGNTKNPFVAPSDGEIQSWAVKLGKPNKKDKKAFNESFGASQARLSILKAVPGTSNPVRYKLLRQSPVESLGKLFGKITSFDLATPLPVLKDQIVALTIPTWAPVFAVGQPSTTKWLASRRATKKRGACTDDEGRANVDAGSAQVKKGKQQPYGCEYNSARLLYTATFTADGL